MKRLIIVAQETPYPPTHGGRVDVWHRYKGLAAHGWQLALVYWSKTPLTESDRKALGEVFTVQIERHQVAYSAERLLRMFFEPSLAAQKYLNIRAAKAISKKLESFHANAVIAEGVFVANSAQKIAEALGVPILLRSHNVEHTYMATQFKLARGVKNRLSTLAATLHLKAFERRMMRESAAVLDISAQDSCYWRGEGIAHSYWIPTILNRNLDVSPSKNEWDSREFDFAYMGNLWAPNNVSALRWFITDVYPVIRSRKPDARGVIAGASPSRELIELVSRAKGIDLIANPPDADAVRKNARVLINPIREGSGLNIKSIEMLFCASPVVMTPFGASGLPAADMAAFTIAEDAQEFATGVLDALTQVFTPSDARLRACAKFGDEGFEGLSSQLKEIITQANKVQAAV